LATYIGFADFIFSQNLATKNLQNCFFGKTSPQFCFLYKQHISYCLEVTQYFYQCWVGIQFEGLKPLFIVFISKN
jgi:hypothetical protein